MSRIGDIIQRKKNEAIMNPGKFSTPLELESGIQIRIRKDSPIKYTIYLSKDGTEPPSEIQIQSFIDNWPIAAQAENKTAAIVFTLIER